MKLRFFLAAGLILLFITGLHASRGGTDIIVKLKGGRTAQNLNKDHDTQTVRHIPKTQIYLIHADDDDDKVLRRIKRDQDVEMAETNPRVRLESAQYSLNFSPGLVQDMMSMLDGQTMTSFNGSIVLKAYAEQPSLHIIGADQVRSISTGAGARVGYIDTGVDPNHPALRPWLEPGADLVFDKTSSEFDGLSQDMMSMLDQDMFSMLDQDMFSMLDKRFIFLLNQSAAAILSGAAGRAGFPAFFGHGTLVAGMIHVVAPDARIVPIKAFDGYGYTDIFTLIQGVYKAIDLNVDVLNMSFSTTEDSNIFHDAIDQARTAGIAIVAAAGNDASEGRYLYPAGYPGVFGVAATDFNDKLASFSNYGITVSVTAPGAYDISTVPGGKYAAAWGTSFSSPIIAGAIALRESLAGHGQSYGPQVINAADSIDALNPGFERKLGRGRLNLKQALKAGK